jgi:hypothetical protein
MKKSLVAVGLVSVGMMLMSASAEARCSSDLYRGWGVAKKWKTGRANARADWSNRVEDHLGWPWSVWAKARAKDESCKWNGRRNSCVTKAYPCR